MKHESRIAEAIQAWAKSKCVIIRSLPIPPQREDIAAVRTVSRHQGVDHAEKACQQLHLLMDEYLEQLDNRREIEIFATERDIAAGEIGEFLEFVGVKLRGIAPS